MPIGRNVRIKWGAEDGARRASMLNTPKNARRDMTHLSKSAQVRCSGTPTGPQYMQVTAPATVKRTKSTVHPVVVR